MDVDWRQVRRGRSPSAGAHWSEAVFGEESGGLPDRLKTGATMKKLLLGTTAIFALAGTYAGAADLPVKARPAPCNCTCDAAQFDGWYIGISGGGAKHVANRTDQDAFLNTEATYVTEQWGGIVGGTLGYNWAKCHTVWGIEIDGSWVNASKTITFDPNGGPGAQESLRNRLDTLLTARVRSGIAMDNMLLYLTGGVAAARFRTTWEDFNGGATPLDSIEIREWRWGWVAGFGTEWAWSPNLTIKSEVLYANFADRERTVTFPAFGPATFTHSDAVWISRIGLNYRFGGAPVRAAY
jgi:outer membrane immunogenic protein